ncbi:MAG TPA: dodecin family protein [Trueperaceae bacterium]|nr:dodecin family protein [Trueperaceae bacterium]
MSVVKVIEVLAQSEKSFEDAVQTALREASRSVRNIKSIYVKEMQAIVDGDRVAAWRVNTKISFALEDERGSSGSQGGGLGSRTEPQG